MYNALTEEMDGIREIEEELENLKELAARHQQRFSASRAKHSDTDSPVFGSDITNAPTTSAGPRARLPPVQPINNSNSSLFFVPINNTGASTPATAARKSTSSF